MDSNSPDRQIFIGTQDDFIQHIEAQIHGNRCILQGVRGTEMINSVDSDGNGYVDDLYGWKFADIGGMPTNSLVGSFKNIKDWNMFERATKESTECLVVFPIITEPTENLFDKAIHYLINESGVLTAYSGQIEIIYKKDYDLTKLLFQKLSQEQTILPKDSAFIFSPID